jgi:DNA-binding MarR family transcriptional regulator
MDRQDLIEALFVHTGAMQRAWKSYFYDIMGAENLFPGQMSILFYLKSHEPVSSKQISKDLLISKSSAAQAIDGLQQLGLVSREIDTFDRRITHTSLSKAGHKKVASLEAKRKDFFIKITAGLTDHEIENLITGQKKMTEQITKHRAEQKGDSA